MAKPLNVGADLGVRTRSAVVLGLAVLGLTWLGGGTFAVFVAGLAGIVVWEWRQVTGLHSHVLIEGDMVVLGGLCVLVAAFVGPAAGGIAAAALAGLASGLEVRAGTGRAPQSSLWAAFGMLYAVLPAMALQGLRGGTIAGLWAVLFLFAVVWATDIAAYFAGRLIGGPKLLPAISPKKTWSGAIGGLVGGMAGGVAVGSIAGVAHLVPLVLLAGVASIVAQAGDLFESWIKRRFSVKDSSQLIPGHGGVMDRVDGLLAAALLLAGIGASRGAWADLGSTILQW